MSIIIYLQILLIIISLVITFGKDNLNMVIFFSVFSLICASLYYFYRAPDLALAEAAIGSAIVPLIFIITISKQREFMVICNIEDDFINPKSKEGEGYKLLSDFTDYYNLKLVVRENKEDTIYGVFRVRNVDLSVKKKKDKYIFEGKSTSIIMNKLVQMTKECSKVDILLVEEEQMDD
ncbi:DUF4040 domain-containing protein [Clostridium sp. D2Q-11]|uniref:DUF4040 domain-containing protein n=1 Tax=Anaeromonas frigoriresistens TaxID=2683708 RepID=A0A942Z8Z1_9FIRM|nr:DUF4040 domain-containing protein [Anaeromonas frigoriresistens]MBS4538355.1 DUF4040 domain-containing protein [Anaeromonas frigoriresistens]